MKTDRSDRYPDYWPSTAHKSLSLIVRGQDGTGLYVLYSLERLWFQKRLKVTGFNGSGWYYYLLPQIMVPVRSYVLGRLMPF